MRCSRHILKIKMRLDPRDFDQKRTADHCWLWSNSYHYKFFGGRQNCTLGNFFPSKDTFKAVLAVLEKRRIFTGILTIFFGRKKKLNGYPLIIPVKKYAILRGFRWLVWGNILQRGEMLGLVFFLAIEENQLFIS